MSAQTFPLAGHHALVTGAGGGIGEAICRALAQQGAHISLLGRKKAALETTRQGLSSTSGQTQAHESVVADVSDHAAVASALAAAQQARGAISILINNAGSAESAPLVKSDIALWQKMLAVNLTGCFNCIQPVLAGMKARGWGRIINIASTAGLVGYAYVAPYCAAKHGVIGLTRALALEVAKQGITVNALCPGYTDTPLLDHTIANIIEKTGRTRDNIIETLAANNPQGRVIQPAEIAHTVLWLCLPGSESIHGQAISIDGGEVM